MTYFLAATLAFVLFVFAGWRSKQSRTRAVRIGRSTKTEDLLPSLAPDEAPADVAAAVNLALKRLLPVMTSQHVRADVAVRPGVLMRMPGTTLADVLEELLAAAIHHGQASRLLVTAVGHGEQVSISVTDDVAGADPAIRAGCIRRLAERVALRGGVLEIEVRPSEGTTMTLRLAQDFSHPAGAPGIGSTGGAELDKPASRPVSPTPMLASRTGCRLSGAI
jgi:glucose-6-phosphate-specific signal transduction histidine kinase